MSRPSSNRRSLSASVIMTIVLFALLIVIGPSVWRNTFAIQNIDVVGNDYCTRQDVITESGVLLGQSIFALKNEEIEANINAHRYLECVSVVRHFFPCRVEITVKEHAPYAKLTWLGLLVLIGDHGLVLEHTAHIDMDIPVPEVIGMTVRQVRVGQPVSYMKAEQGEVIEAILTEIHARSMGDQIAEIHVSLPNSLYLTTWDGLQIMIGNEERLADKFDVLMDVMPSIMPMGDLRGCTLDVSTGKSADFRPLHPFVTEEEEPAQDEEAQEPPATEGETASH